MATFLLEIFSEEIPARMQQRAAEDLAKAFKEELKLLNLTHDEPKLFVTPRRLAILISGLPEVQPDSLLELKGPKVSAPETALNGFLKSNNLRADQLQKRIIGKDEVYFYSASVKGLPTNHLLISVVEGILKEFPWPKSMRWGSGDVRWVRPLHSILCLFDGKVVPVEFGGIKAGNVTCGHRFLAPDAITIKDPGEYEAKLKAAKVVADFDARKAEILSQAEALAARHGLSLKRDDGLLAEVTGLVEWPTLLLGTIDAKFMDLPPEVLVSEMRAHQKYFALNQGSGVRDQGSESNLSPTPDPRTLNPMSDKFLITSNMITSDGGKAVIAGNERVLRARLSDGRFFWDQDRKKPLSEWAKGLEGVTFHARIGTVAQKAERVKALAVKLAEYVSSPSRGEDGRGAAGAPTEQRSPHPNPPPEGEGIFRKQVERAAQLCKADLTTGMVGEFPELQGVMGRYYALAQKEDAAVADAIRDHYLPLGPDSPVPTQPVSICVALADKLDTLVSMFAAGEKPTGSKDPFALRRSALGIIRIILENRIRLPLSVILSAAKNPKDASASPQHDVVNELLAFFSDRLKVQLKDSGIRHDLINAVMANGDDDLLRVVARARALQEFLGTDDGTNLLAAYRRASNIVSIEEKKDKQSYSGEVDPELLQQPEEKELYERLTASDLLIKQALQKEEYGQAMTALAASRKHIDAFFDKVLVNAEDKTLRANRLNLLARIRATLDAIADFSKIES